jgi:hypothetical protein
MMMHTKMKPPLAYIKLKPKYGEMRTTTNKK